MKLSVERADLGQLEHNMTKTIRVENADISNHKIRVFTEQYNADIKVWIRDAYTIKLDNPTDLYVGIVHKTQRMVIEEIE